MNVTFSFPAALEHITRRWIRRREKNHVVFNLWITIDTNYSPYLFALNSACQVPRPPQFEFRVSGFRDRLLRSDWWSLCEVINLRGGDSSGSKVQTRLGLHDDGLLLVKSEAVWTLT